MMGRNRLRLRILLFFAFLGAIFFGLFSLPSSAQAASFSEEFNFEDFRNVWTGDYQRLARDRIGGNGSGKWNVWLQNWWTGNPPGGPYPVCNNFPDQCPEYYGTNPGNARARVTNGYLEMFNEGDQCSRRNHRFQYVKSAEPYVTSSNFELTTRFQFGDPQGWGVGFGVEGIFKIWNQNNYQNTILTFDGIGDYLLPGFDQNWHVVRVRSVEGKRDAWVDGNYVGGGQSSSVASGYTWFGNEDDKVARYGFSWQGGCPVNDGMGPWPILRVDYLRFNFGPENGSVTSPSFPYATCAGPGAPSKRFITTHSDPDGYNDLQYVHLLINGTLDGNNSAFYGYYNLNNNHFYLYDSDRSGTWLDAGVDGEWDVSSPYATLKASSTHSTSGDSLTVYWDIEFLPGWTEDANLYLYTIDDQNLIDNWEVKGTYRVQSTCVVETVCRTPTVKGCTADNAQDPDVGDGGVGGNSIDDIWCTWNIHDDCQVKEAVVEVNGQVLSGWEYYPPAGTWWEGESCGGDPGSSFLSGEKKVFVDDLSKYLIQAKVYVDDNSRVWINGQEIGGLQKTWPTGASWYEPNPWAEVTSNFQSGQNTIKFEAEDTCSGERYFNLDWNVIVNTGTIEGDIWEDTDRDGQKDAGEPNYTGAGVTLRLDDPVAGRQPDSYTGGHYTFVGVSAVGHTVYLVAIPAGYISTTSTSLFVTVPKGGTVIANFGIVSTQQPWFQTQEGDAHVEGNLSLSLPTSPPYFSSEDSGTPGVVSAAGTINFFGGGVSTRGWKLTDYSYDRYPIQRYDYEYFEKQIGSFNSLSGSPTIAELNGLSPGFYKVSGDLTIPSVGGTWVVSGGKKIVILAEGNLNINNKIFVQQLKDGSFLAIIVKGDIFIGSNVFDTDLNNSALDGVFIANGKIFTGSTIDALRASGVFAAHGGFNLQRTLNNPSVPAEKFIYHPNLVMNTPQEIISSSFIWQEIAP